MLWYLTILVFNSLNAIYPIVTNYSVIDYIPIDLIITSITLFMIRSFFHNYIVIVIYLYSGVFISIQFNVN